MKKRSVVTFGIGIAVFILGTAGAADVEHLPAPVGPVVEEMVAPSTPAAPGLEADVIPYLPKADFDGNAFGDLAVGAPRENVSGADMAGSISAMYWTTDSDYPSDGDYWTQGDTGVSSSEADDQFGRALAVGDFDGDGVFDLAIGAPEEDWQSSTDAGIVHVLYGVSGTGLSLTDDQYWHQDSANVNGTLEPDDFFGFSLAAGDFNGDGYDDLAIGVPYEDAQASNDGAVNVLYGTSAGLSASADEYFVQSSFGLTGGNDEFLGRTLAAGDFNGDGYDDLAMGAPGEDVSAEDRAGAVFVAVGSSGGLTVPASGYWWHQNVGGVSGASEAYDGFGGALTAGDFDDDGYDDLVVGVPGEDLGNPVVANAGAVHVLYGSSLGTTSAGELFLYQGFGDTSNSIEDGDEFGSSLGVGDFNGDAFDDLVVGVSDEDWGAVIDTGMIHIFSGGAAGLDDFDQYIHQGILTVNGTNEDYDGFGFSFASTDFNGDGFDDLAIGSPVEDIDSTINAGWVTILWGTATYVSYENEILLQSTVGGGEYEEGDYFGWAVAAAPFETDSPDAIFVDGFESGDTGAWTTP